MLNLVDHPPARLLIIDDDPLLRGMAANTLRHAGFDVSEAQDGIDGLELVRQTPFDLLLLDVMMPRLDGYEVCKHVRQSPRGERLPILMLTGLHDSGSIEQAYEAGATDFISKPINWTLLSHRVRYSLRAGQAIESAMRSHERLERAQHIANMGSWEWRAEDERFVCSPELARVLAAPPEVVARGRADDFLARIASADREAVRAMRQAALYEGRPYQQSFVIHRFDGVVRTVF